MNWSLGVAEWFALIVLVAIPLAMWALMRLTRRQP